MDTKLKKEEREAIRERSDFIRERIDEFNEKFHKKSDIIKTRRKTLS